MKIAQADLSVLAGHRQHSSRQESETLRAWRGERPDFAARPAAAPPAAIPRISDTARQALAAGIAVPPAPTFTPPDATAGQACAIDAACEAADNDPFLALVRQLIEFLTGEKMQIFDMAVFSAELRHVSAQATASGDSLQAAAAGRSGWGVEYDYHAVHEESETTTFSASGTIRTADGQEISFRIDLAMSRYYREETHVSLRAGDAVRKDPLVVNFGGTAVQLAGHAGQRFRFDLDGDGRKENLPLFASGSGYLALDLNSNGRIDSGRELFGPRSGDGFADLAKLDGDGNGWIDTNDAVFDKLRVWTPQAGDGEGAGALRSLAELGIGALGLGHVATPFALRGDGNRDLGIVRSTGVYLADDGTAGTLQEIDLTV